MGLMFCRYCGAHILEDSVFCAKCGKRLGGPSHPGLEKIARTLHLHTPYPYTAVLVVAAITWFFWPRQSQADYSHLKWSIEFEKKMDFPEDHLYQQSLSLVLENAGPAPVHEIPVELSARIEPPKTAEVVAGIGNSSGFLRKLVILQAGRPLPVVAILSDTVEPGKKRRYYLEGSIQADPPFKVTYEIRPEDSKAVLASYVVQQ